MEQAYKLERERLGSTDFGERNTSYNIVKINSFKEASEYGKYTPWCVAHEIEAFNDYTNNGICVFYFCLKDGFENVPEKIGEGCPLDEYGLSMIAVCVDENGECKTVTCRWNHNNGGNDDIMSTEELSRLLGVNFYEVFKPSTVFKEKLEKALSLAKKGDFSGFDDIDNFDKNGIAKVELNDKCNLIDVNCNLLSKQWFDWIDNFNENGISRIELNNKWNLIDTNGNLLYKQWFDNAFDFNEYGISIVVLNDKWNFIDTNGNFLSRQWFDWILNFENGIAKVKLNHKWNFIDTNGNFLSKQWFDNIYSFDSYGIAQVTLNGKCNFIDVNGNFLSKKWFDNYIYEFKNGFARVTLNDKWNLIDTNGNLLSKRWFDWIDNFNEDGFAVVRLNNKYNLIDTNGNLLSKQWFDSYDDAYDYLMKMVSL